MLLLGSSVKKENVVHGVPSDNVLAEHTQAPCEVVVSLTFNSWGYHKIRPICAHELFFSLGTKSVLVSPNHILDAFS